MIHTYIYIYIKQRKRFRYIFPIGLLLHPAPRNGKHSVRAPLPMALHPCSAEIPGKAHTSMQGSQINALITSFQLIRLRVWGIVVLTTKLTADKNGRNLQGGRTHKMPESPGTFQERAIFKMRRIQKASREPATRTPKRTVICPDTTLEAAELGTESPPGGSPPPPLYK
jgi:hypothetical protein